MSDIGKKIKDFRQVKKLTQIEFAERLNVSAITIIRYENGSRNPKSDFFDKIAQAFPGTNISLFFSDELSSEMTQSEQLSTDISESVKIIKGDEVDLKAMWKVLWDRRISILKVVGIFTMLGLIYALISTPLFLSSISIVPASEGDSMEMGSLTSMAASFGVGMPSDGQNLNITDIVASRRLKQMILDQKWQVDNYPNGTDMITYWEINDTTKIMYKTVQFIKSMLSLIIDLEYQDPMLIWTERALAELEDRIVVTQGESGLITVEVWMEERQLVTDIAEFIGDAVIAFNNEVSSEYWGHNREFIQQRMGDVKAELDEAEKKLTNFQMKNRRITDSPELQMVLARHMRDVEIQTQLYMTLQREYEMARIEEVKDTPSIVILDEAYYPAEIDKPKRILIILLSMAIGFILSPPIILSKRAFELNKITRKETLEPTM